MGACTSIHHDDARRCDGATGPQRDPSGASRRSGTSSFAAATADESRAAEIGRDILANGGNATDAAVAMYFALAVTLPSAASLGASGACIVHDDKSKQAESFVFAPIAAPGPIKGASFSVPNGLEPRTGTAGQSSSRSMRTTTREVPVYWSVLAHGLSEGSGAQDRDCRATEDASKVVGVFLGECAIARRRGERRFGRERPGIDETDCDAV